MPLTPHYRRKFRGWVDFLQEHFPPPDSNQDASVCLSPDLAMGRADCLQMENGVYHIRIGNRPPTSRTIYSVAVYDLLHEWAHALAYDCEPDHSDAWGLAYAAIYRAAEARSGGLMD